jgi:glycosyltransferase involved in cell wall biosynthesis
MNLLILSNNPTRASFRQRIGVYLDLLQADGISCQVNRLPKGTLARRKLFKQCADFDVVFLHKKRLNCWDTLSLRPYSRKIIYDFDDAIMFNEKHSKHNSLLRQRLFRRTVKLAHLIIAGNSYLADHAAKYNTNVEVLPTGLNVNDYQIGAGRQNDGKIRMVWIGSKSTLPYLTHISEALEKLGKKFPQLILRIICDDFFELNNMPVEKKIWSLENQALDLSSGDIGLAPLPDNPFTRGKCGFKILQYWAAALPVVASPIGVNSSYVKENVNGSLASETCSWVDKISDLIENPLKRNQMGLTGRKEVEQYFDVPKLGKQLSQLIRKSV